MGVFLRTGADFGVDGAVCVSQPRYVDVDVNGHERLPSCWDSKPTCDDWELALEQEALLGNKSAHEMRQVTSECGD